MRAPRLRGLGGAALAVGGFAAALAVPHPLADGRRPMPAAEREPPECALDRPCIDGRRDAWIDRIDGQLSARLPQLDGPDRVRLAVTIVDEAGVARVDPLLVLALIEIESSFDPRAESERGAHGLMQLRPATMRRELERARLPGDDLRDPVANVRAGVRYFRRLLDAFGGDEVALMAYNAGPNRILAYLREGDVPARFRAYPRRVMAEHRRLRRSVGIEPAPAVAEARRPQMVE